MLEGINSLREKIPDQYLGMVNNTVIKLFELGQPLLKKIVKTMKLLSQH